MIADMRYSTRLLLAMAVLLVAGSCSLIDVNPLVGKWSESLASGATEVIQFNSDMTCVITDSNSAASLTLNATYSYTKTTFTIVPVNTTLNTVVYSYVISGSFLTITNLASGRVDTYTKK